MTEKTIGRVQLYAGEWEGGRKGGKERGVREEGREGEGSEGGREGRWKESGEGLMGEL